MTTPSADFFERQAFRQWWMLVVLALPVGLVWVGAVNQVVFGNEFGDDPIPDLVLVGLWLVFGIGLPTWLWSLRLETTVDGEGVHVRFRRGFARRSVPFDDIQSFGAVNYRPIRQYGGWGVRWGGRGRMAFNVSGDRGVELELIDGKSLLIGSQQPDELTAAIERRAGRRPRIDG